MDIQYKCRLTVYTFYFVTTTTPVVMLTTYVVKNIACNTLLDNVGQIWQDNNNMHRHVLG